MSLKPSSKPEFDAYAASYDQALDQGLSVSGEDKEYFAQGRVRWLARRLEELGLKPGRILDFGCGTGTGAHFLAEQYPAAKVLGVDVSGSSLETARRLHGASGVGFRMTSEFQPNGEMDLAFCNGVFHHVPPAERAGAVKFIWHSLRLGGVFAFWENNPWNPGTRYVMSRIPFDQDAIMLSPRQARRLLADGGFEIIHTDFLFVFPRLLGWLRPIEIKMSSWPVGAQYVVICRKV